jgi:hypothetical protein
MKKDDRAELLVVVGATTVLIVAVLLFASFVRGFR